MQTNLKKTRRIKAWTGAGLLGTCTLLLSGCHIDMWVQPKVKPFYQSDFFGDQQGSRPLVAGTVPQGVLKQEDPAYFQGRVPVAGQTNSNDARTNARAGGQSDVAGAAGQNANLTGPNRGTTPGGGTGQKTGLVKTIPVRAVEAFASPKEMLLRGKDRYAAYCTPCHGRAGDGNGFIAQRGLGYWQQLPASYHTDRLRKVEDGHIYDVIVNGYGVMYGYSARIQDVNDRWAVVAYVRALQLARVKYGGVGRNSTSGPLIRPGDAPPNREPIPSNTTRTPYQIENPSTQIPGTTATPAPMMERPSNSRRDSMPGLNPAPKPGAGTGTPGAKIGEGTGSRTETGNATSGAPTGKVNP